MKNSDLPSFRMEQESRHDIIQAVTLELAGGV